MAVRAEGYGPPRIDLPRILDARGNLSFLEEQAYVPFTVRRVYWIYDVPGGEERVSHAFRATEEVIVALSGSFEVALSDGETERVFRLGRSHVPQRLWRTLRDFSTNSVALVLASTPYDEADCIRDFDEFRRDRRP